MKRIETIDAMRDELERRIAAALSLGVATNSFEGRVRRAWAQSTIAVLEELLSLLPGKEPSA